jgi:hypothetical protein
VPEVSVKAGTGTAAEADTAERVLTVTGTSRPARYPAAPQDLSFTRLTRHINAVLRDEEEPRLLAIDTALPVARALHDMAGAAARDR